MGTCMTRTRREYICRYAGVPVDFEEVKLDQSVTDEDYDKALLAIRRNYVALKGNSSSSKTDTSQSFIAFKKTTIQNYYNNSNLM